MTETSVLADLLHALEILSESSINDVGVHLGPGAVFGEQGLLLGQPRNANVTALEAVTLMRVDKATFMDIFAASDSDYQQLKSLAAARTDAAGQS